MMVVLGCGGGAPDVQKVTGKVMYDGKPLADADVTFVMEGGKLPRNPSGKTGADGTYELTYAWTIKKTLKGAPVGKYKVTVKKMERDEREETGTGVDADSEGDDEYMKMAGKGKEGQAAGPPGPKWLIPEKYTSPATTPITKEVTEGDNSIDITLDK